MKTVVVFLCVVLNFLLKHIYANQPTIVSTQYGDILGYETNIARVFYGIPFAEPPINDLRWKPPVSVSKWSPKVWNATSRAPACPQTACGDPPSFLCPPIVDEDCLYLNVFTPLIQHSSAASLLPVMLFIHGGNFQYNDASLVIYEAERLVNDTNIVVALIQYRLGALGFLATGKGADDIKGNYGILDQRMAIAWIKANIDAFGGDPNQITLFGQSAGAQSISLHHVTSEMQSFFQASIIQSSPMTLPFRTYGEYATPAIIFSDALGCGNVNISCLRRASFKDIVAAQTKVDSMITSFNFLISFEPWVPVIDNIIVKGQLTEIVQNVSFPLKPLLIGTLTEEAVLYIYGGWSKPITLSQYLELGVISFHEKMFEVLERYPPEGEDDQRPVVSRIATQWVFACSTRFYARQAGALYSYVFGYPLDFDGWGSMTFCNNHVCHGTDLPYTFESTWNNFTDAGRRVSKSMATYWTNFAKTHNPNEPAPVPVIWPKLTANESYLYFQDPVEVRQEYLKDECDFWDTMGYKSSRHDF